MSNHPADQSASAVAAANDPATAESTGVESADGLHQAATVHFDGALEPSPATVRLRREVIGSFIGPYKLLKLIGEGGMGAVYLAEQERPVRRQVALKIIKPGMDSAEVITRFEAERQALALMDHQSIAR